MDLAKYFAITHARHVLCNPLGEEAVDELIELLDLPPSARVLDIGCGKGEFLVRTARRWGCHAVGVELNPAFAAAARERAQRAQLDPSPEILEGDGAAFAGTPGSFALSSCIGASWIWGGLRGTLEALADLTRPGGLVLVGEPFWAREASPEHIRASGLIAASFGTHARNVETGSELGLDLLHTVVSSPRDWDRYEGLQWAAVERYARDHPDDPDVPELVSKVRELRDHYLRWGRDEIGWALYLFAGRATRGASA